MTGAIKFGLQLRPLDTWFFRDGTPFSADGAPQEDVNSLFPPHPATVAGAVRAWLALHNGWNGRDRWSPEICEVLGDGPDELGKVSLECPFILRCGRPLFRAPRHLLGTTSAVGWKPRVLLRPGNPVLCDLGDDVRLPALLDVASGWTDARPGEDIWLNEDGMRAVLKGRLPRDGEVMHSECIWAKEPRIGLERDTTTRTAEEGMLYSSSHVRPGRGVSLGVRIAGVPDRWTRPFGSLVPLGGESRLAEVGEWDGNFSLASGQDPQRHVTLVALSPLDLPQDVYRGRGRLPLTDFGDALVVSACLGRPQRVGGWDSRKRRPVPMKSVLAPGSVLFCELPATPAEDSLPSDGLMRVGARQEWGFGLVAVGRWPCTEEMNP